jgi:hypothetical protein
VQRISASVSTVSEPMRTVWLRSATWTRDSLAAPALVAQGIEHRPPEPCAQVRILPRALHFPSSEPRIPPREGPLTRVVNQLSIDCQSETIFTIVRTRENHGRTHAQTRPEFVATACAHRSRRHWPEALRIETVRDTKRQAEIASIENRWDSGWDGLARIEFAADRRVTCMT